jgi:hypothetical protein
MATAFSVRERTSGVYSATLRDEAGAVIPDATLESLTLSRYVTGSGAVVNNRDQQDVLNTNDVTVDSSGTLTWAVRPADNAIVGTHGRRFERHRAVFQFTWSSGTKRGWHAVEFLVQSERAVS